MAENDNKRYYWLKLKKDFFQQHQIKVLKSLPNGRLYALIYLELLAESTSHDGELRYSKMLPYDIVTLSSVIDEDKDNVEKAIETLARLELVEVLDDGTIYLREIQKLIGSETGKAIRMRDYRKRLGSNEPKCSLENRVKSIENRVYEEDIDNMAVAELVNLYKEAGVAQTTINSIIDIFKMLDVPVTADLFSKAIDAYQNGQIYNKVGYVYNIIKNEREK